MEVWKFSVSRLSPAYLLQLPFSQSSGFTPIKLPLGLDGDVDNFSAVPSTDTTPAKSFIGSTVGSPFSAFSLPKVRDIIIAIIGVKYDFLCINICLAETWARKGFNTSRGAQQMLMYQKNMFDRYYCIKLLSLKTSEKMFWKVLFFLYL